MASSEDEIDQHVPPDRVPKISPVNTGTLFHPIPQPDRSTFKGAALSFMNRYRYQPLKNDEIRIIKLLPKEVDDQKDIVCSISHKSLSRVVGKYEALSYHWGNKGGEMPRYPIQVKASRLANLAYDVSNKSSGAASSKSTYKNLLVHANLWTAMKQLQPAPGQPFLLLWVDYICIKQTGDWSEVEKSEQVPRMADIYNNAVNVIIWLGEGQRPTDDAMDFISEIIDLSNSSEQRGVLYNPESLDKWNAFTDLMRFHWFSRRWVVQEVALARKATLRCGSREVRWDDFETAVSLFTKHLDKIKKLYHDPKVQGSARHMQDVEGLGAIVLVNALGDFVRKTPNGEIKKRLVPIEALVSQLLFFAVSRPHDAIYSLLSLARDTHLDPTKKGPDGNTLPPPFDLKVNYQEDPIKLFTRFTALCIRNSKSLDIICRYWAPDVTDGDYPSWILRISDSTFGSPEKALVGRRSGDSFVGAALRAGRKTYEACGAFKAGHEVKLIAADEEADEETANPTAAPNFPNLPLLNYQYYLTVQGIRIGIITKVFPRVVGSTVPKEWLDELGLEKAKKNRTQYPDILWRTLVADRDQHGNGVDAWYRQAFEQCLREVAVTDVNGDFHTSVESAQSRRPLAEDMLHFLSRVRSIVTNRCMFKAVSLCEECSGRSSPGEKEHRHLKCPFRKRKRGLENGPGDSDSETALEDGGSESLYGLGPGSGFSKFKSRDTWVLCVLKGCTVPVVLRKVASGVYSLVGESFVYGKMDGEAVEGLDEDSHEFDNFILV
jgi:hypothetical protein